MVIKVLTPPLDLLRAGLSCLGEVCPHGGQLERHVQVSVVQRILRLPKWIPHEVEFVTVSHPGTVVVVQAGGVNSVVLSLVSSKGKVHLLLLRNLMDRSGTSPFSGCGGPLGPFSL